jgi:hypothetical protein
MRIAQNAPGAEQTTGTVIIVDPVGIAGAVNALTVRAKVQVGLVKHDVVELHVSIS